MSKGINFITSCQRMIYSTYWASDIDIQNISFVIIPICSVRYQKIISFFLIYKYDPWLMKLPRKI